MAVEIFHHQGGAEEQTLTLRDDGTLALWISQNYPPPESRTESMTIEQAKQRWPEHGAKIDEALSQLTRSN